MENKKLIVIGGGHAGVEAAAAIARMGCEGYPDNTQKGLHRTDVL